MLDQYSRTKLVMGASSIDILKNKRVTVFGIGGVGGYAVEALARSGVGTLDLIDDDKVCLTNLNRQIFATRSTIGQYKVDAAEARIHDIEPRTTVNKHRTFYMPDSADEIDLSECDYVVDAIDTVTAKLDLISRCSELGIPIISAMGCGNRFDPTKLTLTDIYKTEMDPLAKVIRRELRKRHIRKLQVVYSTEPPIRPVDDDDISCREHCICPPGTARKCTQRRDIPGSTAFVPAAAGLIIASAVVRELTAFDPADRIRGGRQD